MANFTGESFTSPFTPNGEQSGNGGLFTSPFTPGGKQYVSGELFSSGGGAATITYYKLRARDSACVLSNPNKYVEWETTTFPLTVASYTGVLPCGGPLVELAVLSIKTV
jgi:hypothetical protein